MYGLGMMCQYHPGRVIAIMAAILIIGYIAGRIIERRKWAKTVAKTVQGVLGKTLTPGK